MLFDTIKERTLNDDKCFLCGMELSEKNRSDEHVIPRWAQSRYELWNQLFVLLNNTTIPYKNLKIPCCNKCNNSSLQPIETIMAEAVLEGPDAVSRLDPMVTFNWLGKIFYGLIHRELFLLFNRKVPEEGTIVTPELIERYSLHHTFLQNMHVPMEFNSHPFSIFVYETKVPDNPKYQWDFSDNLFGMFVSVRMGRVGMVAALQDGGAHGLIKEEYQNIIHRPLHPIQHRELGAMFNYNNMLLNRVPKFLITETHKIHVFLQPLGGLSGKPIFDEWVSEDFVRVLHHELAQISSIPIDNLWHSVHGQFTWLYNEDGSSKNITFEDFPWPPPDMTEESLA